MLLESAACSDVGRVRDHNEDSFLDLPSHGLFAVADGMGGHAAGEVASRLAIQTLQRRLGSPGAASADLPIEQQVAEAILQANAAILAESARDPGLAGMGTTITVAVTLDRPGELLLGHVGDSRAYRMSDGQLVQLTTDHTVVQRHVEDGSLSLDAARHHPLRHLLTRALGTQADVEVDVFGATLGPDEILLLCSDGLTGMVDDEQLASMLADAGPLPDLARRLVSAANDGGGEDNITVVLVRTAGGSPPEPDEGAPAS